MSNKLLFIRSIKNKKNKIFVIPSRVLSLMSFLYLHRYEFLTYHFSSLWKTSLNISSKVGLLAAFSFLVF